MMKIKWKLILDKKKFLLIERLKYRHKFTAIFEWWNLLKQFQFSLELGWRKRHRFSRAEVSLAEHKHVNKF